MFSILAKADAIPHLTALLSKTLPATIAQQIEWRPERAVQVPAFGLMPFRHTEQGFVHQPDWYFATLPLLLWMPDPDGQQLALLAQLTDTDIANEDRAGIALFARLSRALSSGIPVTETDLDTLQTLAMQAQEPHIRHALLHNLFASSLLGQVPEARQTQAMEAFQDILAMEGLPTDRKYFSVALLTSWLQDMQATDEARYYLEEVLWPIRTQLPPHGRHYVHYLYLSDQWPRWVDAPSSEARETFKQLLWDTLTFYQQLDAHHPFVPDLYQMTAQFAMADSSWSEALNYIGKAIDGFETLGDEGAQLQALRTKGYILWAWAQNGQPQFFDQALKVLQQVARQVYKDDNPEMYADLQHTIGIILAQKPVDAKKRGIMAGMAETAFQEAMQTARQYGMDQLYARICNNYGNALQSFPDSRWTDKYDKALFYYQEALDRRPADQFAEERARILANYLEASWHAGNAEAFSQSRYEDMKQRAEEILQLTQNPELCQQAQQTLQLLEKLKQAHTTST